MAADALVGEAPPPLTAAGGGPMLKVPRHNGSGPEHEFLKPSPRDPRARGGEATRGRLRARVSRPGERLGDEPV